MFSKTITIIVAVIISVLLMELMIDVGVTRNYYSLQEQGVAGGYFRKYMILLA